MLKKLKKDKDLIDMSLFKVNMYVKVKKDLSIVKKC
jgi:hypothetical protein